MQIILQTNHMSDYKSPARIESRVINQPDISHKIMNFISHQAGLASTPFQTVNSNLKEITAKRSLTDWRQLYIPNNNKINPNYQLNPSSAQGQRNRCISSQKCKRHQHQSKSKMEIQSSAEKPVIKRRRAASSKREDFIQFAIAQNIYERQLNVENRAQTAKQKDFYESRVTEFKRTSNKYIPSMKAFNYMNPNQKQLNNPTQTFIGKLKDMQKVKILPYNVVKIRQKFKINNSKFFDSGKNPFSSKQQLNLSLGLRFYERT